MYKWSKTPLDFEGWPLTVALKARLQGRKIGDELVKNGVRTSHFCTCKLYVFLRRAWTPVFHKFGAIVVLLRVCAKFFCIVNALKLINLFTKGNHILTKFFACDYGSIFILFVYFFLQLTSRWKSENAYLTPVWCYPRDRAGAWVALHFCFWLEIEVTALWQQNFFSIKSVTRDIAMFKSKSTGDIALRWKEDEVLQWSHIEVCILCSKFHVNLRENGDI